ncbi:MAG: cation:proton antiporter subunit C [Alphaproteobacteria bacterium]|nr:cation:proton antiporter subunit C [Alphaproteobacteria bacterium]
MNLTLDLIISHAHYWVSILLMMIGFFAVITQTNLVKKMVGLIIFQTSVLLLYISLGKINGAQAPIITDEHILYTNPLPHVLMLTAIVVGVSVLAVGLAIIVRIKESYGTIEEHDIVEQMDE